MALTPDSFRRSPRMLAALMVSTALLSIILIYYYVVA